MGTINDTLGFRKHPCSKWLRYADTDYCVGRFLITNEKSNMFLKFNGLYTLHQVAEKYIKTLLVYKEGKFLNSWRGHDLTDLYKKLIPRFPDLESSALQERIQKINPLKEMRYPDQSSNITGKDIREKLDMVDLFVKEVRSILPDSLTPYGIKNYIGFRIEAHSFSLIRCLIKENKQAEYWRQELSGIDGRIDYYIKRLCFLKQP